MRTTTFIAGLRRIGILAPLVLDGSTTGTAFCACIDPFVAPALKPGGVVVLDNIGGHKVDASPAQPRPVIECWRRDCNRVQQH